MSHTFHFMILSPGGKAFEGAAEYARINGALGSFGVMAHHAPLVAAVAPGPCIVTPPGSPPRFFYTGEGVLEVTRKAVVLLVDEATAVESAEEAKKMAALRARLPAERV